MGSLCSCADLRSKSDIIRFISEYIFVLFYQTFRRLRLSLLAPLLLLAEVRHVLFVLLSVQIKCMYCITYQICLRNMPY